MHPKVQRRYVYRHRDSAQSHQKRRAPAEFHLPIRPHGWIAGRQAVRFAVQHVVLPEQSGPDNSVCRSAVAHESPAYSGSVRLKSKTSQYQISFL